MDKKCFLNRIFIFVLWGILSVGAIVVSEEGILSHAAVSGAGEPSVTTTQMPASDAAVEVHTEGEAVWTYHKDTKCLVISGKGNITFDGKDNSITDSDPDGYPWNVWYKQCYRPDYASEVEKIVIESGITRINAGAFHEYNSLKTIEIADTVTVLEEYVFWWCKKLKTVTMGDGVREIGEGAFSACTSLTEITIGKSVEDIGDKVFFGCPVLKEVKLDSGNTNLVLESGILYNRQKTILYFCPVGIKSAKVPKSVKKILSGAFSDCKKLKKITFPKGSECSWIGQEAFYGCVKLKEMLFPDAVQYVGSWAFYECKSLQRISLGRSFVGFTDEDTKKEAAKHHYAPYQSCFTDGFVKGKIQKYTVSKSNTRYSSKNGVLYNKKKTKLLCYPQGKKAATIKIPGSVKVIQKEAFEYSRYLKKAVLPRSLKKIEEAAFAWSPKLKTVTINGKHVIIGERAFCGCRSLSKVDLGNSVREIKESAFYSAKFKEIHIPSSVVSIEKQALGKGSDKKRLPGGTMKYTERDVAGFKIYGKKGSEAERYAKENGFVFIAR